MQNLTTDLCTRYQQVRSANFARICRQERIWKCARSRIREAYARAWERAKAEAADTLKLTQEDCAILELEILGARSPNDLVRVTDLVDHIDQVKARNGSGPAT
jgi:hypothetical protein